MFKINNTKTINNAILSLGILAILALGVFFLPKNAEADYNYIFNVPAGTGNYNPSPVNYNQNYYPTPAPTYYQTPTPVPTYYPVTTQTSYYETPTVYSSTKVASATTKKTTNTSTATKTATVAKTTPQVNSQYNSLAANAFWGTNSFMPSGLLQWIVLAIIILIIVILAKRIFGQYHRTPLKHA